MGNREHLEDDRQLAEVAKGTMVEEGSLR